MHTNFHKHYFRHTNNIITKNNAHTKNNKKTALQSLNYFKTQYYIKCSKYLSMCSTTSHTSKDYKLVYYHVHNSPKILVEVFSHGSGKFSFFGCNRLWKRALALAASSTFGLYTSKHSLSNSNSVWSLSATLSPKFMSFHICWSHTTAVSSKTN